MSSNNFIVTGQQIFDKILCFCRHHPEQVSELYETLSGRKIDLRLGGKSGKIGFSGLKHWLKDQTAETIHDLRD